MRAEDMLALVGNDHSLSRDPSGGSFSLLFSDEASQAELQRAMNSLQDGLSNGTPGGRATGSAPTSTGASPFAANGVSLAAAAMAQAQGWLERSGSMRSLCSNNSVGSIGGSFRRSLLGQIASNAAAPPAAEGDEDPDVAAVHEAAEAADRADRQSSQPGTVAPIVMPTHAEPRMHGDSSLSGLPTRNSSLHEVVNPTPTSPSGSPRERQPRPRPHTYYAPPTVPEQQRAARLPSADLPRSVALAGAADARRNGRLLWRTGRFWRPRRIGEHGEQPSEPDGGRSLGRQRRPLVAPSIKHPWRGRLAGPQWRRRRSWRPPWWRSWRCAGRRPRRHDLVWDRLVRWLIAARTA